MKWKCSDFVLHWSRWSIYPQCSHVCRSIVCRYRRSSSTAVYLWLYSLLHFSSQVLSVQYKCICVSLNKRARWQAENNLRMQRHIFGYSGAKVRTSCCAALQPASVSVFGLSPVWFCCSPPATEDHCGCSPPERQDMITCRWQMWVKYEIVGVEYITQ